MPKNTHDAACFRRKFAQLKFFRDAQKRFNLALKIMETALRDGHQCLMATRLTTQEMLPILEEMDNVGYHSMEVWGGATFDACLRYLNEDPWERLRQIRSRVKNTKLQMLLRGQNLLGYKHYADDVVEAFIQKSIENGIDIIRVFDALNDLRNIQTSMQAIQKYKGHCQAAISYTTSPVHTIPYFTDLAKKMQAMGADSICIKDMAGILTPYDSFELVTAIKKGVSLPIEIHTHCTGGIAEMTYLKAIEAGVDIIDTAVSPFSGASSQPATESFVKTLENTQYATGLNQDSLDKVAEYFKPIRDKYLNNGILNPKILEVVPKAITYQVPGGMLSNLLSQLESQGKAHLYQNVLEEVPKVRADLGYPPLVTPLSQMVGTQAVMNVVFNERYKIVPNEIKDYVRGAYGAWPSPISEDIKQKTIGNDSQQTSRPADSIAPELEKYRKEAGALAKSDEDVLSYALFPQIAQPFFEKRNNPKQDDVVHLNLTM